MAGDESTRLCEQEEDEVVVSDYDCKDCMFYTDCNETPSAVMVEEDAVDHDGMRVA